MLLMLLANVVFLIFGLITAKASAKVLNVSQPTVWTAVCLLCVVGSYALNNNFFDVIIMFVAALLGFVCKVYDFPTRPFVLERKFSFKNILDGLGQGMDGEN